ncbi:MAG: hypothetical protein OEZ36_09865 [Spirochaetota bacterium]|nr:hypothetical protein [Spirochaetota bacterium]
MRKVRDESSGCGRGMLRIWPVREKRRRTLSRVTENRHEKKRFKTEKKD